MLGHEPTSGHYIRVVLTYIALFAAVIAGTVGVVFLSKGYRIDIDDQEIVRTGLVRIESSPNALVFVDGENSNADTPARLNLGAGSHEVQLFADGYTDWYKRLDVEGGRVQWLTYPFLIPGNVVDRTKTYTRQPAESLLEFGPVGNYMLTGPDAQSLRVHTMDTPQEPETVDVAEVADLPNASVKDVIWAENGQDALLNLTRSNNNYWVRLSLDTLTTSDVTDEIGSGYVPLGYLDYREGFILANRGGNVLWLIDLRDGSAEVLTTETASYGVSGASVVWLDKEASSFSYWDQGQRGEIPALRQLNADTTIKVSTLLGNTHVGYETNGDVNVIVNALSEPYERRLDRLDQLNSISPGGRFLLGKQAERWHSYDLENFDTYEFDQEHDQRQLHWAGSHHLLSLGSGGAKIVEFDGYNTTQLTDGPTVDRAKLSNSKQTLFTVVSTSKQDTIRETALR